MRQRPYDLPSRAEERPSALLPNDARAFTPVIYGFETYGDLFTKRQLVALTELFSLVAGAMARCLEDALRSGMADDHSSLDQGGNGATAYAQAIGLYLSFVVSSLADRMSTICTWDAGGGDLGHQDPKHILSAGTADDVGLC